MRMANENRMGQIVQAAVQGVQSAQGVMASSEAQLAAGMGQATAQSIQSPSGALLIMCGVSRCGGPDVCGHEVTR